MRFLSRGRSFLGLLALVVPTLLLLAATAVPAKLLPKSQCLNQCQDSITAQCTKTKTLKNGRIKTRIKPACKARLIRLCRKQKAGVCTTTTTTSLGGTTTTTGGGATTTTTTTSTTSTTCSPSGCVQLNLDFTNGTAGGHCGDALDGTGTSIKPLTCGGLNIGGGGSTIHEGPTPDGSTNRFQVSCADVNSVCTLKAYPTAPAVNSAAPDCTVTGCNFGTPLEIPNQAAPNLTVCVLNSFATDGSGTLSLVDGTSSTNVSLISDNYITGNLAQPCPRCRAGVGGTGAFVSGSHAAPATGFCDRGPRTGQACTSANSVGLTRDCPTGGVGDATHSCEPSQSCVDGTHVGKISVDLSPLTTGAAMKTDANGKLCPRQGATPGTPGCFGQPTCRTITENGKPAGPITVGTPATATLASVFCIAATGNGLVDFAADLPGPGATSLPGTFATSNP